MYFQFLCLNVVFVLGVLYVFVKYIIFVLSNEFKLLLLKGKKIFKKIGA